MTYTGWESNYFQFIVNAKSLWQAQHQNLQGSAPFLSLVAQVSGQCGSCCCEQLLLRQWMTAWLKKHLSDLDAVQNPVNPKFRMPSVAPKDGHARWVEHHPSAPGCFSGGNQSMDILWFGNVSRIERGQNGSNPHSRIYRHIGHIPFLQGHIPFRLYEHWRLEGWNVM